MATKIEKMRIERAKKDFKAISIEISQIKKNKANAYRENKLEEAKQLEITQNLLRELADSICLYLSRKKIYFINISDKKSVARLELCNIVKYDNKAPVTV